MPTGNGHLDGDPPELALERIGRRRDMAEELESVEGGPPVYEWPRTALEAVRRFYERIADEQMEALIRSEIERHARIERRLKADYEDMMSEAREEAS